MIGKFVFYGQGNLSTHLLTLPRTLDTFCLRKAFFEANVFCEYSGCLILKVNWESVITIQDA